MCKARKEFPMKAITIKQPFAELIASGAKRVENRSWQTHHRGVIAIHAGWGQDWMFKSAEFRLDADKLPCGAIIAVAELIDCVHIDDSALHLAILPHLEFVRDHEHTHGPWCWVLASVRRLEKPIACSGKQGLWNVPEEQLLAISHQLSAI